jgi:uracil-DNA glycosylase
MYTRQEAKTQSDFNNFAIHLQENATHVITIPGTTFKMFLKDSRTDVTKLLKQVAKTTAKGSGTRRVKASPVLHTIEEFRALTAVRTAA